jgi:sec-independent protein translocase protein TatA
MTPLFGVLGLSPWEIIIIGGAGLLIFGRNLPGVARSLGKSLVEFKKGFKGLEDEIEGSASASHRQEPTPLEPPRPPKRVATTAPKFEENTNITSTPPQV